MGIRENFQKNLKFYRKQKGLSQEKLSELIGFGETYITEIETRHKFPKPEFIDIISKALGIEPHLLFIPPEKERPLLFSSPAATYGRTDYLKKTTEFLSKLTFSEKLRLLAVLSAMIQEEGEKK